MNYTFKHNLKRSIFMINKMPNAKTSSNASPKKTREFQIAAKNFDNMRTVLRNMYLYSFRSRADFADLNIEGRTYDDLLRRIKYCIDQNFIKCSNHGKTKIYHFQADLYQNSYNFLINTFYNLGIQKKAWYYILILQLLSKKSTSLTRNEIIDSLVDLERDLGVEINEHRVYNYLTDLKKSGIVIEKKVKKTSHYSLAEDIFSDFTLSELQELYNAVIFYTNLSLTSIPGHYLLTTLEEYAYLKFNTELAKPNFYQFRSNSFIRLIDDSIITKIGEAIKTHANINITYCPSAKKDLNFILNPKKIITEYPYNKQYVTAGTQKFKIELITDVKPTKQRAHIYRQGKEKEPSQQLELLFTFKSDDNNIEVQHLRNRLIKETAWMKIEYIDDEHILYTARVHDALKFLPWIRTYAKYVSLTPKNEKILLQRWQEDRNELRRNYGLI